MNMTKEEYEKTSKKLGELEKKEQQLVIENMPIFERGIVEAAVEREKLVWDDIKKVMLKYGLNPSVSIKIVSNNQPSYDIYRPNLVCPGVKVSIEYIVNPVDREGKDGRMSQKVIDEINLIKSKENKLVKKLNIK